MGALPPPVDSPEAKVPTRGEDLITKALRDVTQRRLRRGSDELANCDGAHAHQSHENTPQRTPKAEVEAWLLSADLGGCWTVLENAGYDDLDTIMDHLTESVLTNELRIKDRRTVARLLRHVAQRRVQKLSPIIEGVKEGSFRDRSFRAFSLDTTSEVRPADLTWRRLDLALT